MRKLLVKTGLYVLCIGPLIIPLPFPALFELFHLCRSCQRGDGGNVKMG